MDGSLPIPFASRIRAFRAEKALTLAECAALLGISSSYLSALEHEARRPTPAIMGRAEEIFGPGWGLARPGLSEAEASA